MKLSVKSLLSALIITAIGIGSAIMLRLLILNPQLHELEAVADRKDIERALIGLDMVRDRISLLIYDYGIWDDTYQYFLSPNDHNDYINSNFLPDMFLSNELNVALLIDVQGKTLFKRSVNLVLEEEIDEDWFDYNKLQPYLPKPEMAANNAPILKSGLLLIDHHLLYFSAITVLDSQQRGPSPGVLVMARFLDQDLLADITQVVKVDFSLHTFAEPKDLTTKDIKTIYRDANDEVQWPMTDIDGQTVAQLSVHLPKRKFSDSTVNLPTIGAFAITLICWLIIIHYQKKSMVEPINRLRDLLIQIRKTGDYSLRLPAQGADEIGLLGSECNRMLDSIESQQILLNEQAAKLEKISYEDALTGLANRRRFDQLLADYWVFSQRESMPLALLFCDVDYFKRYNDYHGHLLGDNTLSQIANAIRQTVNRSSSLAARYGGEEFAIILPNTDIEGAGRVAEQLIKHVRELHIAHQHPAVKGEVTISVGIAMIRPSRNNKPADLIQHADQALYLAKGNGRNRAEVYRDE